LTVPVSICVKFNFPRCGDLKIDPDETCDDGNTEKNDGCSSICEIEEGFECHDNGHCYNICGDGIIV